jgi:hypothetical protein
MSDLVEQIFRLSHGVDVYNPDVNALDLQFSRLKNIQPWRGRMVVARGFTPATQNVSGKVLLFMFSTEPYTLYSSFFAFTDTHIYAYDFIGPATADQFSSSAIYTWPTGSPPIAAVSWYDRVYATRQNAPLLRLIGDVAFEVPNAPGGRYMVLSNSHLMIANLAYNNQNYPNRVRWSDIYDPESWEVTEDSEADFFELEPGDGEIMGLSYQRGNNLIYTRVSIWIAQYNPLPNGYKFSPLYTDVGCNFHGGQVSVKEKDYFIGTDNIYMVDGLQLQEIGDPIWKFFKSDCVTNASTGYIVTRVIKEEHSIAWIYDKLGGGYWSIVYNYKENKWSDRDPQDVFASIYLTYPLRGFLTIDMITDIIDLPPNDTRLIDGDWQFPTSSRTEVHGGLNGKLFIDNLPYAKADTSPINCEASTYEFFVDTLVDEKEFDILCLHYAGFGRPNIKLSVGRRKNRLAPVEWQTPREAYDQLAGETMFHFRNDGVGKLVQFKFSWDNTNTNYVSELTNLSLHKLDDGADQPNH